MFSVGEYIVYGVEGVCRGEEAGKLKVAGLDKNRAYYRLRPYNHDGTLYTPVDGKAGMRPALTREELERLLPRRPELEPLGDVPPDSRAASLPSWSTSLRPAGTTAAPWPRPASML